MQILTPEQWEPRAAAHAARAREATAEHLERRRRGIKHPVWDFLFDYYGFPPGQLARWHTGPGVGLVDAPEHAKWRHHRTVDGVTSLDVASFVAHRGTGLRHALGVLEATHTRAPRFDCFGLHEWAMVYRLDPDDVRHQSLPLRLGRAGTDAVVESHELRCSHFDAFRFFTPAAVPRNWMLPLREEVTINEQPGCLHGGVMDLYRWSFKLAPAIPSELTMDCFDLAKEARVLDMRSSPYDVSSLGFENIPVETTEGKHLHVELQRDLAARAMPVRGRLLAVLRTLAVTAPTASEDATA